MAKFLMFMVLTVISAVFGLIPEAALYLIYHMISPTSDLGRIVLGSLLTYFGIGVCLVFAILAFCFWVHGVDAILKS